MSLENPNLVQINGYSSDGYEPFKELFAQNFHFRHESNAQLCIYVNNVRLVDLYRTAIDDTSYTYDTIHIRNAVCIL